jgi:hypothetical protein
LAYVHRHISQPFINMATMATNSTRVFFGFCTL